MENEEKSSAEAISNAEEQKNTPEANTTEDQGETKQKNEDKERLSEAEAPPTTTATSEHEEDSSNKQPSTQAAENSSKQPSIAETSSDKQQPTEDSSSNKKPSTAESSSKQPPGAESSSKQPSIAESSFKQPSDKESSSDKQPSAEENSSSKQPSAAESSSNKQPSSATENTSNKQQQGLSDKDGKKEENVVSDETETDKGGFSSSDNKATSDSKLTSSSTSTSLSRSRRKERRKKKKLSSSTSMPKLRSRKTSKIGSMADQYLQNILLSYFHAFDPQNSGLCTQDNFWNILLSAELNLQLNHNDIQGVQNYLTVDESGMVIYNEFVRNAQTLITSIYSGQPDTAETNWVEIRSYDQVIVSYNKKTGEIIDNAEAGMELFEDAIKDLFSSADTDNKGVITAAQFNRAVEQKLIELNEGDRDELVKMFSEEKVSYANFKPIGKETILRYYRAKNTSESEWAEVTTPQVGRFWLNVLTGETRRNPGITEEREQEAALISQAYSQIESLNLQLEQEKLHTRDLENQIALTTEELEVTATQLDETGKQLDEINLELQLRETEVSELQSIISEKDQYIDELNVQVTKVTAVKDELAQARAEIDELKRSLQEKDALLAGRDQTIDELRMQSGSIVEELKNAHGIIDARESSIDTLQYNLTNEQGKVKELKQHMPSLETRLSMMMDELVTTKKNLDEKMAILLQTRDSLKKARTKTTELEKENAKLFDANSKLKNAECEIRTLKSFLTSKTATVEKKKKEIQELKLKMAEIESRDNKRAIILADVLEKTARTFQHQLTSPRQHHHQSIPTLDAMPTSFGRPVSAPLVPPEDLGDFKQDSDPLSMSYVAPPIQQAPPMKHQPKTKPSLKKRGHIKSRTVPRLPPIRKQKSDFVVPTEHDVKHFNKQKDSKIHPHTSSINCQCELCIANRSRSKAGPMEYGTSMMAGNTDQGMGVGLARLALENEQRECQLSKQLKIGQRALVQIKKSMFDLEPQKLTGTIKYIGKVDSEYLENRIYVGLKLDDPVGNSDGIYKGRRYFTCPPSHGRMVRITNVIAVMPNKGLTYKPLQIGLNPVSKAAVTGRSGGGSVAGGHHGDGINPYVPGGRLLHPQAVM